MDSRVAIALSVQENWTSVLIETGKNSELGDDVGAWRAPSPHRNTLFLHKKRLKS
jgi:hypothetical protein